VTTNQTPDYEAHIAANLARVIAERENLNAHRIAQAMTARGVTIDSTGLKRVMAGTRRIKFNEAVCLSSVIGVEISELTLPPALASSARAREAVEAWKRAQDVLADARDAVDEAREGVNAIEAIIRAQISGDECEKQYVLDELRKAGRAVYGEDGSEAAARYWMKSITGDSQDQDAWLDSEGVTGHG